MNSFLGLGLVVSADAELNKGAFSEGAPELLDILYQKLYL